MQVFARNTSDRVVDLNSETSNNLVSRKKQIIMKFHDIKLQQTQWEDPIRNKPKKGESFMNNNYEHFEN